MEIVLIRHGEPDWEPGGFAVDDPELTPRGRAQAERAAEALARERFDALYVSPLRRAAETVAPICERLGLEARPASWMRELELPPMTGLATAEVRRFFEEARARDLEKWWEGPPGGESFRHFHERVTSGVEGLLVGEHRMEIHQGAGHRLWRIPEAERRVLLVAHEGTNALVISHLLGIDPVPWEWVRFSSAWAGISRLRTVPVASGAVWVLSRFNDVAHLDGLDERFATHEVEEGTE